MRLGGLNILGTRQPPVGSGISLQGIGEWRAAHAMLLSTVSCAFSATGNCAFQFGVAIDIFTAIESSLNYRQLRSYRVKAVYVAFVVLLTVPALFGQPRTALADDGISTNEYLDFYFSFRCTDTKKVTV